MANTIFKLTASKADTPISGDNPGANPTSTPSGGSSAGKPGTGYGTAVSQDIINTVSSPIVSGTFLFIGFILLLALIIKIKKNKQAAFDAGLNKNRYTTRILGFATFLALIAGIGGTAARFIGAKADTEVDALTTSGTINASLIEVTDDYKLYCGTDQLILDQESVPYGNFLFMYADDDGILPTTTTGISNIASAEDWDGLGIGEWGYFVGTIEDRTSATTNPMPLGYSIISNEAEKTLTTTIPVTYCAKISKNIEEAEFEITIEYELMPRGEGDIYPEIDFNSANDADADGLSNREENRYGMNPLSADSDMDSLSDYDELKVHHTDPLAEDTDEDGLADYSEVSLSKADQYNFDPNTPDYNGESLTYSGEVGGNSNISYTVTGTGDIPLTYIEPTNPVDVEESLGSTGTAYTLQSAGEITGGEITAPYTTETTNQGDDDTLGAADLSGDDLTDNTITATVLAFDEENAEDDFITADITYPESTINSTNKTITMPITSSQQIIIVGNAEDDGTLGAGLLSKVVSKVKAAVNNVKKAVKSFVNDIKESKEISKCIKSGGAWATESKYCIPKEQVDCQNSGKIWSKKTNRCLPREQGNCENDGGTWDDARSKCKSQKQVTCENKGSIWRENSEDCISLSWNVSNGFTVGRDSFKSENVVGWYDEDTGQAFWFGGHCFGMSTLARLLYKNKITLGYHDLSRKYDVFPGQSFGYWFWAFDPEHYLDDTGSELKDFSLSGLSKEQILNNTNVSVPTYISCGQEKPEYEYTPCKWHPEKEEYGYFYEMPYVKGPQGKALMLLSVDQLSEHYTYMQPYLGEDGIYEDVEYVSPETFINTIKNKIDKKNGDDDPIILDEMGFIDDEEMEEHHHHSSNEARYPVMGKIAVDGHATNALSLGLIYQKNSNVKKYHLYIYDNNFPEEAQSWEMRCSLVECVVTSDATLGAENCEEIRPEYASLTDEDYFLYH